jgi:hypothetical protein
MKMLRTLVLGLAGIAAFTGTATPSRAALIDTDLFSVGDAMLTYDDDSGLEWLDVTATRNLSVNDILGGAGGWLGMGFRYATAGETCDLFSQGGLVPDPCPGFGDATVAGNQTGALIPHLGDTGFASGGPGFRAVTDTNRIARFYYHPVEGNTNSAVFLAGTADPNFHHRNTGHLLVRDTNGGGGGGGGGGNAVPEPTSALVFAAGAAVIGGVRRKRA